MSGNGKSGKKKGSKNNGSNVVDIGTRRSRPGEEKGESDNSTAQDLIYDAWETPGSKKRIELAKKALRLWPDCADAYNILAEDDARTVEEASACYLEGVRAGERALGKKAFEEFEGHFWGLLETRPYMRARAGLAHTLILLGEKEKAAKHYMEMLVLNPGDNQGIRYELAALLVELDNDEELESLLDECEGDITAAFAYTRALAAFRRSGDTPDSRELLAEALERNGHVPEYLLVRKKIPEQYPATIGFGDESEAVYFACTFSLGWAMTEGALQWLGQRERELRAGVPVTGKDVPPSRPGIRGSTGDGVISRKVGRNEPCPCGSGKKFKKCCGAHDTADPGGEHTDVLMEEFGESVVDDGSFESLEQLQAETGGYMGARNVAPIDDFDGLSADQMHWLLYRAFDPGSPVVFRTDAAIPGDIRFLRLFIPLLRELGEGPVKETVTGNLPRKIVRAVAQGYFDESSLMDKRFMSHIRGENDFMPLHVVRLIAGMGGFIRKKYQRFRLTKRSESVVAEGMSGESFLRLMDVYIRKFNWGYRDRHPDLHIVQMAAFFTLYLLQKYGGEDRPLSFYGGRFLRAFPAAVNEVSERAYMSREDTVRSCFNLRAMDRFCHFFGFMEYAENESGLLMRGDRVVRKTTFLDDFIRFQMD